jgi:SAM-dependent methyltransferase
MKTNKTILDVCCGGRMFWFDKKHPDTLYVDRRQVKPVSIGKGRNARMFECTPDKVMDFRKLNLPDDQFSLVVFDPPHFTSLGSKSYMAQKYGALDSKTWKTDLRSGFAECFRVLKPGGILIFKWNEYDIRLSEVLALTPQKPLFGHPSGKTQKTHWVTFMKPVN